MAKEARMAQGSAAGPRPDDEPPRSTKTKARIIRLRDIHGPGTVVLVLVLAPVLALLVYQLLCILRQGQSCALGDLHQAIHHQLRILAHAVSGLVSATMRDLLLRTGLFGAAALTGLAPTPADATLLYVSSYIGTVTTLNLTLGADGVGSSLTTLSTTNGCAPSPSWLTLDRANGVLYCSDEGLSTPNSTLSSFKTGADGKLTQLGKVETINGPVSSVIYGEGGRGLALAQ
jgi:hypothetical protein